MHLDPDRLALLALGEEPVTADVADHLASCPPCQAELESMRDVVDLGRNTDSVRDLPSPPPRVWDSIMRQILAESQMLSDSQAAALAGPGDRGSGRDMAPSARTPGDDVVTRTPNADRPNGHSPNRPTAARHTGDPHPRGAGTPTPAGGPTSGLGRDRGRVLHATAIAVAAVVIGVAGTLGIVVLRDGDGTKLVSRTQLSALPAAPPGARGSAEVVHVGSAIELRLTLTGMPSPDGYYEAWLFDPATGTMYPMGPVAASGGTVTVTGVDIGRYRGVDISAQSMDGTGGHGQTMLRGALK
jgi:Anti-sigma-K factor rskA, C-terminal